MVCDNSFFATLFSMHAAAAAVSSQFILLQNEDHLIGTERELYPILIFHVNRR